MSCCALRRACPERSRRAQDQLREASRLAAAEPLRFAQGDSVRKSYGELVLEGKGVDGMRKRRGVIILVLAALGVGFIVNTVVQQQDDELRGIPSLQAPAQQSDGLATDAVPQVEPGMQSTQVAQSTAITDSTGVLPVTQGADVQEYRERNERGDCWVDHSIQFQADIGGPGAIGRGGDDFSHQLKILRKWTDSNCESLIREDSQFVLGAYDDPVRVKIKTYGNGPTDGDVILKGHYGGDFQEQWSADPVTLRFGSGLESADLDKDDPLCCERDVHNNEIIIFSQTELDSWTKMVEFGFDDRALWYPEESFHVIVHTSYGSGKADSKPMEAQWTIPIYRVGAFNRVSYVTTLYPIVTAYYTSG